MQNYEIIEYGNLNTIQKEQVVEIFLEGFGHMMTFRTKFSPMAFLGAGYPIKMKKKM